MPNFVMSAFKVGIHKGKGPHGPLNGKPKEALLEDGILVACVGGVKFTFMNLFIHLNE